MKTISFINLKGGVGKTVSTDNIGHTLATRYKKRVLIIDNDKQANTTKYLGLSHSRMPNLVEILLEPNYSTAAAIRDTKHENLKVIGADMRLLTANLQLITDETREQTGILRKALDQVRDKFDYCLIDNAPDINISVINALFASEEVIIPVKIDQFGFDGLDEILKQLKYNPSLTFRGCLITQYNNNDVNNQGAELLRSKYPVFNTLIRNTPKIIESTFARTPILDYSPRCAAAKDYISLVKEYLGE